MRAAHHHFPNDLAVYRYTSSSSSNLLNMSLLRAWYSSMKPITPDSSNFSDCSKLLQIMVCTKEIEVLS